MRRSERQARRMVRTGAVLMGCDFPSHHGGAGGPTPWLLIAIIFAASAAGGWAWRAHVHLSWHLHPTWLGAAFTVLFLLAPLAGWGISRLEAAERAQEPVPQVTRWRDGTRMR